MDPQTRDLMKVLKTGARDAATLDIVENLLAKKRDTLIASGDGTTLSEISELLERWAEEAPDELAARALLPAAELALQAGDKEGAAAVYCGLGELRTKRLGDLNGGIEAFESALDAVASVDTIGRLADLFAQRAGAGDAEQAADLYYTLSDVAPKDEGIKYAERALDLIPGHEDALRLLERLIPEEKQAERLSGRWEAYLQHAQPGSAQDARRASLARVHASEGRFREAVDILAPLTEKGDLVAKQLKNVFLEKLQDEDEHEQHSAESSSAEDAQRSATRSATQAQREAGVSTQAEDAETLSATQFGVQRQEKALAEAEAEAEAATQTQRKTDVSTQAESAETLSTTEFEVRRQAQTLAEAEAEVEATRAEAAAEAEARAKAEADAAQAILEADAIRAELQAEIEARAIAEAEVARLVEERDAAERAEAETRARFETEAEVEAARAEAAAEAEARAKAEADATQAILEADAVRAELQAEVEARAIAEAEVARLVEERDAAERAEAATRAQFEAEVEAHAEAEEWTIAKANTEVSAARAEAEIARARADQATRKALEAEAARLAAEEARAAAEEARERAEIRSLASHSQRPRAAVVASQSVPQLGIEREDPTPVISPPRKSLDIDGDTKPIAIKRRLSAPPSALLNRRVQIGGAAALALLLVVLAIAFGTNNPLAVAPASKIREATADPEPKPGNAESTSAPVPLNPRVRTIPGRLRITGGKLPKANVLTALNERLPALKSCYRLALKHTPSLQGSLVYTMQVKTDGHPTDVKKIQGNITDEHLMQCGTEALEKARFTKPEKRAAQVKAVFYFRN